MPDFIDQDEHDALWRCAELASNLTDGLTGLVPRMQNLGGYAAQERRSRAPLPDTEGVVPERLPPWCASVCHAVSAALGEDGSGEDHLPSNHVLINEYPVGAGFGLHKDGAMFAPHTATLSLGSHTTFQFANEASGEVLCTLVLPPRGLLIFSGDAYETCLHSVPATAHDTQPAGGWLRLHGGLEQLERSIAHLGVVGCAVGGH